MTEPNDLRVESIEFGEQGIEVVYVEARDMGPGPILYQMLGIAPGQVPKDVEDECLAALRAFVAAHDMRIERVVFGDRGLEVAFVQAAPAHALPDYVEDEALASMLALGDAAMLAKRNPPERVMPAPPRT